MEEKRWTTTGDCYRDFAFVQPYHLISGQRNANNAGSLPHPPNSENFPVKLHYMLREMEKDGMQHVMSWQTHGRCFHVHDQKYLEKNVLPMYVITISHHHPNRLSWKLTTHCIICFFQVVSPIKVFLFPTSAEHLWIHSNYEW